MESIVLDDCRFVKNEKLAKYIYSRAVDKLKELKNLDLDKLKCTLHSAVIDLKNFHKLFIYSPFKKDSDLGPTVIVVTEIYLLDIKTLDELLKTFILSDRIRFMVTNISSFFFDDALCETRYYQLMSSKFVIISKNIAHEKEGVRLFNIIKSTKCIEGQIYIGCQQASDYNYVEIYDIEGMSSRMEKIVFVGNSCNKHNFKSFFHNIFSSINRNKKNYEKLKQ